MSNPDIEFDRQLSEMPLEYLKCRKWRHKFTEDGTVTEDRRRKQLAIGLTCDRCGLEADDVIDANDGTTIRRRIWPETYPDGYLFSGTGRMTRERNGMIALTIVRDGGFERKIAEDDE
jgi:hypothetical protein